MHREQRRFSNALVVALAATLALVVCAESLALVLRPSTSPSAAAIYHRAAKSLVLLESEASFVSQSGIRMRHVSIGSGIALTQSVIVTNAHVVWGATRVQVLMEGREAVGQVIGILPEKDLALLRIPTDSQLVPPAWASRSQLSEGETVFAMGSAAGDVRRPAIVNGLLSGIGYEAPTKTADLAGLLLSSVPVSEGFSGGPLLNREGEVAGIVTAVGTTSAGARIPGLAYAIPADEVLREVPALNRAGTKLQTQPTLGLALMDGPDGVVVNEALRGGPAHRSGVHAGDRLLAINGLRTRTSAKVTAVLDRQSLGSTVTLLLVRGDRKVRLSAPVGNAAAPE